MIARCALWEADFSSDGVQQLTRWHCCGRLPALLDKDGDHLCEKHFAQCWECANCQAIGETMDDIRWSGDAGYCAACWTTVEEDVT
jgi:hypothetical protein